MEKCLIVDDSVLAHVSAGVVRVSNEAKTRNVVNFYLNLVPGVHTKHRKVTYNESEWSEWTRTGNSEITRQDIEKVVEDTDMSWKVLSKSEKLGVCLPGIFTGCMVVGVGACNLARWIKTKV